MNRADKSSAPGTNPRVIFRAPPRPGASTGSPAPSTISVASRASLDPVSAAGSTDLTFMFPEFGVSTPGPAECRRADEEDGRLLGKVLAGSLSAAEELQVLARSLSGPIAVSTGRCGLVLGCGGVGL